MSLPNKPGALLEAPGSRACSVLCTIGCSVAYIYIHTYVFVVLVFGLLGTYDITNERKGYTLFPSGFLKS